ncbi:hypothetical protein D3C71_1666210 [compost metagenome]
MLEGIADGLGIAVEAVEVRVAGSAAQRQLPDLGISEQVRPPALGRRALLGIRAQHRQPRLVRDVPQNRRRHGKAVVLGSVGAPIALAAHHVEAIQHLLVRIEGAAEVGRKLAAVICTVAGSHAVDMVRRRPLGHHVDHAAGAPLTEQDGRRPLQHFNAVELIQVVVPRGVGARR